MSRAATLRCWTICAAVLVLGAVPARAQQPDSTAAPGVTARADSGRVAERPRKKHRKRYDDVAAVTELTAALGRIIEPTPAIAPEPKVVADVTLWAVPAFRAMSGRQPSSPASDRRARAGAIARELEADSAHRSSALLGNPVGATSGTPASPAGATATSPAAAASAAALSPVAPTRPAAIDSPTVSPLTLALGGAPGTSGTSAVAPTPGNAVATPALGTAVPAPVVASGATAAAGSVLGKPVGGFEPDATRVGTPATNASFLAQQLASLRVARARGTSDAALRSAFEQAGVPYPGAAVYLRAFKREHELEVWGRKADGSYALIKTMSICSLGGSALGPKLHRGDEQVPEGFYHVVEFNPSSEYHLSLRLDYPNAADRARKGADDLGGDIYLHGGCKSAGCLPLTDTGIELVYWVAVQARSGGQQHIPIDIFPARLDQSHWAQLSEAFARKPELLTFWGDLKAGYDAFERTHRLPDIAIDAAGRYRVALASH